VGAASDASLMSMTPLYAPLKPLPDPSSATEPLASSNFQ
jgi:hypothetical protein